MMRELAVSHLLTIAMMEASERPKTIENADNAWKEADEQLRLILSMEGFTVDDIRGDVIDQVQEHIDRAQEVDKLVTLDDETPALKVPVGLQTEQRVDLHMTAFDQIYHDEDGNVTGHVKVDRPTPQEFRRERVNEGLQWFLSIDVDKSVEQYR